MYRAFKQSIKVLVSNPARTILTTLGIMIGIVFGGALGWIVAAIANASGLTWVFSVPWYAIVLGFGVSAIIGISFGVLPARSAAKLDPIEALSHE